MRRENYAFMKQNCVNFNFLKTLHFSGQAQLTGDAGHLSRAHYIERNLYGLSAGSEDGGTRLCWLRWLVKNLWKRPVPPPPVIANQ